MTSSAEATARGLRGVSDVLEIQEVLNRYALCLDDRDWSGLAACFTPDATADYGALGIHEGYPAIEALVRGVLGKLDGSQHFVSNHVVTVRGEEASARCYLQAQHIKRGLPGGEHYLVAGQYRDDLVRSAEGWRIRLRKLQILWAEGNPDVVAS